MREQVAGRGYRLGCDIGGTFTDFVIFDATRGEFRIHKRLTTPRDPSQAVLEGVKQLGEAIPGFLGGTEDVIHGTTLVINAVIERKGSKTGLLTTGGHEDALEMGRENRYDLYDVLAELPAPLVPRRLRKGVHERLLADGTVLEPLREEDVRRALKELGEEGVQSVAVCFLHSFRNPAHERRAEQIVRRARPEMYVSLSADVLPEIKEFERASTTVINAYVKPLMDRYLTDLMARLEELGFGGEFYVMLSSGGVTSLDTAKRFPVRVIESGPAAGAIAAAYFGRKAGLADLLSFDMGGTTAKSCLILNGQPRVSSDYEVARTQRFKKGSGLPVGIPVVDMIEIGAGGGSIARINAMGLLQVGPESAGADPGPACYGLGGEEPTVTDADLLLGYLNAEYFLGGRMRLERARAERAVDEGIAKPLRMDIQRAAWGIHDLVNEYMAQSAKIYVAEAGEDPTRLTMVAFGGAGPVHAYGVAKRLKIPRILVPVVAGVASALGFLTASRAFDLKRTFKVALGDARVGEIERVFRELEAETGRLIGRARRGDEVAYHRSAEMRYVGQGYEVNVPLAGAGALSAEDALARFNERYQTLYGRTYPDVEVEFVNLRVVAEKPTDKLEIQAAPEQPGADSSNALKGVRKAFCPVSCDAVDYDVYDRYTLRPGARIVGPAIVEEAECTTVIGAGGSGTVDGYGTLHIVVD